MEAEAQPVDDAAGLGDVQLAKRAGAPSKLTGI